MMTSDDKLWAVFWIGLFFFLVLSTACVTYGCVTVTKAHIAAGHVQQQDIGSQGLHWVSGTNSTQTCSGK